MKCYVVKLEIRMKSEQVHYQVIPYKIRLQDLQFSYE